MDYTMNYQTESGKTYQFNIGDILHLYNIHNPKEALKITKFSTSDKENWDIELENQSYRGMFYTFKLTDKFISDIISHKTIKEIKAEEAATEFINSLSDSELTPKTIMNTLKKAFLSGINYSESL